MFRLVSSSGFRSFGSPSGLIVVGGFSLFSFPLIVKFYSFAQSFGMFEISLPLCGCSLAVYCISCLASGL
ncbi:hypothetical protein HMPREF1502_3817 [Klebsiella sp. AS10]|nr:hypothetical protein HMPREF1502_3817 [Klebsiella sp. AS10]